MLLLLVAVGGGLVVQFAPSKPLKLLGYLSGLDVVGIATRLTHAHDSLAYALWAMTAGAAFPDWISFLGLSAAWLTTFVIVRWLGGNAINLVELTTVGTIGLVHLGTMILTREGQIRARLALTDPMS